MSGSGQREDEKSTKLEMFSGESPQEYKRWRRRAELHLLGLPSTVGKTKWGPRLLEALTGEAWELLETVPISDIVKEDGHELVFSTLDGKYKERQQDELQRALKEYFYQVSIKPNEEFRAFIVRLESTYRLLVTHGCELPKEVRGWLLMKKMHLDQTQEALILTAAKGNLDYREVVQAIHAVFPHGKGQSTKSKDVFMAADTYEVESSSDEHEVFETLQGIADQVQDQDDYDSEEAIDVFENYKDIKRRVQDKKMGRGFKKEKWNITGSIKAKVEALKSRTRCHTCNKLGHWKKECPEKKVRNEGRKAKGDNVQHEVNFCELDIPGNHDAFLLEEKDVTEQLEKPEKNTSVREESKKRDEWALREGEVWRFHRRYRRALFSPHSLVNMPVNPECLTGSRTTVVVYENGQSDEIHDNFKNENFPMRLLDQKWKGITKFHMKQEKKVHAQGQGEQVISKEHFIEPDVIDSFEAQVIQKGGSGPSHLTLESEEHSVFDGANAPISSHAVPDTACRKTLIGQYTLRDMERHVHDRGLKVKRLKGVNVFRFGNAGELTSTEIAHIPVYLGSTPVVIKAAVLPGSGAKTPLLLSKELLKWLGCKMNMDDDVMMFSRLNEKVKLGQTDRGHYAIPLFHGHEKPFEGSKLKTPDPCLLGEDVKSSLLSGGEQELRSDAEYPDVSVDEAADGKLGPDARSTIRDSCPGLGPTGRCVGRRASRVPNSSWDDAHSREVRQKEGRQDQHQADLLGGQALRAMGSRSCGARSEQLTMHEKAVAICDHEGSEEGIPCENEHEAETSASNAKEEECTSGPNAQDSQPSRTRRRRLGKPVSGCGHGNRELGGSGKSECGRSMGNTVPGNIDARGQHSGCVEGFGQDSERLPDSSQPCVASRDGQEVSTASGDKPEMLLAGVEKLEKLEKCQDYDLLYINLNSSSHEISELFSVPRVTEVASCFGLKKGPSYDIRTGHDLREKELQDRVRSEIKLRKPKLVVICPPCGPYSSLQNLNPRKNSKEWLKMLSDARILHRFGMQVAQDQIDGGRYFLYEQPRNAKSWDDREVQRISQQPHVQLFSMDQCMFGLKDRISHKRHKKATGIMVNSMEIRKQLERHCDGSHEHEPVLGKVKLQDAWIARSRLAQEYPRKFCMAICRGLMREIEARNQAKAVSSVLAVEELENQSDERKIASILRRCHNNLGHPSTPKFIAMLKAARASEKCLKIAKGLTCTTCDAMKQTKSHRVAKVENATQFNQVVCMDTFEVELPQRTMKFLNIVDSATRYQVVVPLWKGANAENVRQCYRRYWKRWAGPPVRVWSDGGPEFQGIFTNLLGSDGTIHEMTGSYSPWQNGMCERLGGVWKEAFRKAVLEAVPDGRAEIEELCDQVNAAHNSLTRKDGFSPSQHVLGMDVRLPGVIMTGEGNEVIESAVLQGEKGFTRRMNIRNAARAAFMNADSEAKVRRAFHARSRVASVPLAPGDLAYIWRKVKGGTCHHWHGPGHVLGTEGSRVWVASGSKVYRCSREQVKRPSEEQEALIRLLPENLRIMRSTIAERGAGNIVNLEGGNLPPDDERDEVMTEAAEPSNGEARGVVRSFDQVDHGMDMFDNLAPVAQRARTDVGPVDMGVDLGMGNEGQIEGSNELEYSPQTPARDDELEPQDLDLDHDHERQVTQVEPHAEPNVLPVVGNTSAHEYGPIRSPSRLTHAMRQNLDLLDHGRSVRTLERNVHDASLVEDELVHEEVYVVHVKKKGRKEVLETELGNHVKGKLSKAKRKEWDKMIASGAVKVHAGEAARNLINEVGKHRLLSSRFVLTQDDDMKLADDVKARWVIRGYLDPDIQDLDTSAPTLSSEGLSVTSQLISSNRWRMKIGDVEAAFLRGDLLHREKGKVLVKLPPGGIPGLSEDSVIELVRPVYGLADAPQAWYKSVSQFLVGCGMNQSRLDPCTFHLKDANGKLRGALAIHVDDLVLGGDSYFDSHVVEPLKKKYPFKHWHDGSGDFLGKKVKQLEDFSIVISQKDYAGSVTPIKISRERRKQKNSDIDENERTQMRALLGEINWMTVCSRPDLSATCSLLQQKVNSAQVEHLIECNKLVGLVRDFSHTEIRILPIEPKNVEFTVWSDASWANAAERKSQGGFLIAMTDGKMSHNAWSRVSPLKWKSFKQDRQVASTLGAELLTVSRALAETCWLRSMWSEAMCADYSLERDAQMSCNFPVVVAVDSKPVYDHVHSQVVTIRDKRIAIEMLLVKQDVQKKNIVLKWIPTYQMIADPLTKPNAPKELLRRVIQEGKFVMCEDDTIKRWSGLKKFNDDEAVFG